MRLQHVTLRLSHTSLAAVLFVQLSISFHVAKTVRVFLEAVLCTLEVEPVIIIVYITIKQLFILLRGPCAQLNLDMSYGQSQQPIY